MKRRVAILPLTCLLLAAAMPVAVAGWVYATPVRSDGGEKLTQHGLPRSDNGQS